MLAQLESVIKEINPFWIFVSGSNVYGGTKNMLLTAGHNFDEIRLPLSLKCATGNEAYMTMSGKTVSTIPGTSYWLIRTALSSILRGPDRKTAITEQTTCVIYTVYAPFEVDKQLVLEHLRDIEAYNLMASKEAVTQLLEII